MTTKPSYSAPFMVISPYIPASLLAPDPPVFTASPSLRARVGHVKQAVLEMNLAVHGADQSRDGFLVRLLRLTRDTVGLMPALRGSEVVRELRRAVRAFYEAMHGPAEHTSPRGGAGRKRSRSFEASGGGEHSEPPVDDDDDDEEQQEQRLGARFDAAPPRILPLTKEACPPMDAAQARRLAPLLQNVSALCFEAEHELLHEGGAFHPRAECYVMLMVHELLATVCNHALHCYAPLLFTTQPRTPIGNAFRRLEKMQTLLDRLYSVKMLKRLPMTALRQMQCPPSGGAMVQAALDARIDLARLLNSADARLWQRDEAPVPTHEPWLLVQVLLDTLRASKGIALVLGMHLEASGMDASVAQLEAHLTQGREALLSAYPADMRHPFLRPPPLTLHLPMGHPAKCSHLYSLRQVEVALITIKAAQDVPLSRSCDSTEVFHDPSDAEDEKYNDDYEQGGTNNNNKNKNQRISDIADVRDLQCFEDGEEAILGLDVAPPPPASSSFSSAITTTLSIDGLRLFQDRLACFEARLGAATDRCMEALAALEAYPLDAFTGHEDRYPDHPYTRTGLAPAVFRYARLLALVLQWDAPYLTRLLFRFGLAHCAEEPELDPKDPVAQWMVMAKGP